jgi:hypothetical protein
MHECTHLLLAEHCVNRIFGFGLTCSIQLLLLTVQTMNKPFKDMFEISSPTTQLALSSSVNQFSLVVSPD